MPPVRFRKHSPHWSHLCSRGGHALIAGQRIGVAGGADLLVDQVLGDGLNAHAAGEHQHHVRLRQLAHVLAQAQLHVFGIADVVRGQDTGDDALITRSEERRVGKEC